MIARMRAFVFRYFVIFCIAFASCKETPRQEVRRLPDGLLLGTATAAYQVEGAWNEDGKTENIYDYLTHTNTCYATDCGNGDVAANSYHMYKRDVEMMRELGIDFYRFSLSWNRLLPTSFPDKINQAGVDYYNNLINEMLKYNIEPVVTLFHWDLPQKLQQLGGWTNPHVVDWFGDYVKVAFELFGDRVKYWITINEPHQVCYYGYGTEMLAPALNLTGEADYLCAKNLLLAHARAYHIYDQEFRPKQDGMIFITINTEWYEPASDSDDDVEAANDLIQFRWGQYAHPIYSKSGDFPDVMKKRIGELSEKQGFLRSRLPEMSQEEIDYVRGTSDLFGLNHYSTYFSYRNVSTEQYYSQILGPSFNSDSGALTYQLPEWRIGESPITMYVPWGFYNLLTYIRNEYDNIPVFITENGMATHGGLIDNDRVTYYRGYMSAMLDAIEEGSNIMGYTAWSLMDNFEWLRGYTERFGIYEIDFEDPARPRTPRKSAYVYKEIVRSRTIDMNYEPDMSIPMTIDA
ncbi:myrosinase 1-like isoform X1 [Leptidea sinapis]|uniref:myrosinase 1-like isoform X1 n=1 Tax=Leptidea sinapis TaxID=189913 RepID=UPI0021433E0A|nr:myrosinase 1-like isoform X1 [Leptidea sinapis]